jgi:hypothetical protein
LKEIGEEAVLAIFLMFWPQDSHFANCLQKNDIGFYFYYEISKFVVSSIKMGNGTCEKLKIKILEYWLWCIGWKSEMGAKI